VLLAESLSGSQVGGAEQSRGAIPILSADHWKQGATGSSGEDILEEEMEERSFFAASGATEAREGVIASLQEGEDQAPDLLQSSLSE
jgi:hypothetical protein